MTAKEKLGAVAFAGALVATAAWGPAQAQDTIKIGVLHSLSGTMAISETTLKDTVLMMIDDINSKGGLLGQESRGGGRRPGLELAAVRRKGRASCSRKTRSRPYSAAGRRCRANRCCRCSRSDNGLLFYPVQYEGEESQKRVLHRRRAEPAGDSRRSNI